MTTFSNTIKLIALLWFSIILVVRHCNAENSELNCIIAPIPGRNATDIEPRNVSMVNKCAKGYDNKDIVERCESLINRNDPYDYKLTYPVISNVTNEAYWNTYCATCNNDTAPSFPTFLSWNTYRKSDFYTCITLSQMIQRSEINDIYNITEIFTSDGVKLIAERFDDTQLECSLNGRWPIYLIHYVIPCLDQDLYSGISLRLLKCQYAEKTGKICTRMKLYEEGRVFYFENGVKIPENITLTEYDFAAGQYYKETEYPGVYYVCDFSGASYGENHRVRISIVVVSLILIIINLATNSNKPYFQQNNTNKLMYFYMVGLIPISIILLLVYLSHPVSCVAFYLVKFFWVYHFFWNVLIFIEFCSIAIGAFQNRISDVRHRYLVYSIFGFLIPISMPIIYYFGVLIVNENYTEDLSQPILSSPYGLEYTCPIIPDHLGVFCTTSRNFGSEYYEDVLQIFLNSSFYKFIPALLVSVTITVLGYFSKFKSDVYTEPLPYKDEMIVVVKMSLITGIHWGLFLTYQNYGSDSDISRVTLDTFCQLSADLHGVIVFIVFGADAGACVSSIMKMFGYEYKSESQQERKNDKEMS